MKVVIFDGKQGDELQPLITVSSLKLELLGKPLLLYILDNLSGLPVSEVIIIVNTNPLETETLFPDGEYKDIKVSVVCDDLCADTAEAVKNVVGEDDETILVIEGDTYFEFDLCEAYSRHNIDKNDATIICRNVEDPREYAIINEADDGRITEIVEKPGWSSAFSDLISCGVYFVERSVLALINENQNNDFIKALFRRAIDGNYKIGSCRSEEYWCKITDCNALKKLQFDLLSGKATKKIPFVASGVFTESSVPSGNFVIIPPVFFGNNVQVESGAVIGPFAVIGEGSLIARGSKVSDSILSKSVYISSECTVNGAFLQEGVSVKKGAEIQNGTVIGKDSLIGEGCVICENVFIWHNKIIENGLIVNENVKYSEPREYLSLSDNVIYGDFGVELTPEKCARLGSATGTLIEGARVGIGSDGEMNSTALKYGIFSGLISVGAKTFDFGTCFYSQMFYYSVFCEVDIAIFISGGENGVSLSFCSKGGVALSHYNLRRLEEILISGEFNRTTGKNCHNVSVVESIEKMYENEIVRQFEELNLNSLNLMFCCGNPVLDVCVKSIFKRLSINQNSEDFIVRINNTGTRVSVVEKNESFSHEKILAIIAFYEMKKGNDVVLLWDAPQIITTLAAEMGRKALRISDYNSKYNSKSQNVTADMLWSSDAVILMFKLIKLLHEENKSLKELSKEIPEFYVAKKVIAIDALPTAISKALLKNDFRTENSGGVARKNEKGVVRVRNDNNGKALKIITEAVSTELAEELCSEIEKLISIDIDL